MALAFDALEGSSGALGVGDLAGVVAEIELIDVALSVLLGAAILYGIT